MAVVGDKLLQPESGWRRYDDNTTNIVYTGSGWDYRTTDGQYKYKGGGYSTKSLGNYASFRFYGTSLRIVTTTATNCSDNVKIRIDKDEYYYSQRNTKSDWMILCFEKTDLEDKIHEVTVTNNTSQQYCNFDAIDINDTGRLLHPFLNEVTSLEDMQIGDCISCEYTASSGTFGTFANLGGTKDLIHATSSATPDGSFYFIHTGYDHLGRMKLVADRVVQHSISWDKLNEAGLCGEKEITIDNKDLQMRLLSGGVSSADKDNEWDKIIAEYDLDGTITAGYNNVWHWNGVGSWTSSTPTTGNTYRAVRGNSSVITRYDTLASSTSSSGRGFRPVLLVPPSLYFSIVSFTDKTYNQDIDIVGLVDFTEEVLDIRYRYLVNGVAQSWSAFGSYTTFNISVPYTLLEYGVNEIKIEVEDEEGHKSAVTVNVYRELTSLLQPIKVYFNETTLNWLPILSTEKLDSITLQKTVESFQNISVTGAQYKDSNLQLNTSYTYKLIGVKDGVEIVESNLVSITTPSEAYLYYLWQDDEYVLRVIEGIAFDSVDVDYDFYTTPNRIIVKPLVLGDLIGGRVGNVFAFEVLNTYEDKDFTISLYATDANQNKAVPVSNYGEFQDSDNPDWRSCVAFDYTSEFTSEGFYPAIFELDAGQKKVIYCKFKPGVDAGIGQKVMYIIATTREVNFNE